MASERAFVEEQLDDLIALQLEGLSRLYEKKNENRRLFLPPEILCTIFGILVRMGSLLEGRRGWRWTVVTQVCRRWRQTARNLPSLWTYLDGKIPLDWLKEMLFQSKGAPVYLVGLDKTTVRHFCGLLPTDPGTFGRVKELSLPTDFYFAKEMTNLLSSLTHPSPLLEELTICARGAFLPTNFLGGHAPNLQTVSLDIAGLPLNLPCWFRFMRRLELSISRVPVQSDATLAITPIALLTALEDCLRLESLSIHFLGMTSGPLTEGTRTFNLPSLKDANLSCPSQDALPWFMILRYTACPKFHSLTTHWPRNTPIDSTTLISSIEAVCTFFGANFNVSLPTKLVIEKRRAFLSLSEITHRTSPHSPQALQPRVSFTQLGIKPNVLSKICNLLPKENLRVLHTDTIAALPALGSLCIEELHLERTSADQPIFPSSLRLEHHPRLQQIHFTRVSFTPRTQTIPAWKRWLTERPPLRLSFTRCLITEANILTLRKTPSSITWDGVEKLD